jgi:secreted PhoX family phosphatase
MPRTLTRRTLLAGAAGALGAESLAALGCLAPARAGSPRVGSSAAAPPAGSASTSVPATNAARPWGPLVPDPAGMLDLPHGFRYVVLQRGGVDKLDDGRSIPGRLDGMTCLGLADGTWALLRNHELGGTHWASRRGLLGTSKVVPWVPADRPEASYFGGVSRVVVAPDALRRALAGESAKPVRSTTMALTGTDRNCAGGAIDVPRYRGWLSGEESDEHDRGYVYFVPVEATSPGSARRIDAWGRFVHEAVAVTPSGVVYLAEDDADGLLYRFVPRDPTDPFGPGSLEALSIAGLTHAHPAAGPRLEQGFRSPVSWLPIPDPAARSAPCRTQAAATKFARCEGLVWDGTHVWVAATSAGASGRGQLLRLTPGKEDVLEVALDDPRQLSAPDNLAVAPWGGLLVCEDNYDSDDRVQAQHLRYVSRAGEVTSLARNPQGPAYPGASPGDEFAGACFSPDGTVLFVNLSGDVDTTFAITGPWPTNAAR